MSVIVLSEIICITDQKRNAFRIEVSTKCTEECEIERFALRAELCGESGIAPEQIACWSATYIHGNDFDSGSVIISDGKTEILAERFRGFGLGKLLMQPIVRWVQSKPEVPVAPITLSKNDAESDHARLNRNTFWEQLGFTFCYNEADRMSGESREISSHSLILPKFRLSNGWRLKSESVAGSLFIQD